MTHAPVANRTRMRNVDMEALVTNLMTIDEDDTIHIVGCGSCDATGLNRDAPGGTCPVCKGMGSVLRDERSAEIAANLRADVQRQIALSVQQNPQLKKRSTVLVRAERNGPRKKKR